MHTMRDALALLENLPPVLTYVILGAGAAVENLVPVVPADTFVVLGSFVATHGRATLMAVFLVTWIANVSSAFAVYLGGETGRRSTRCPSVVPTCWHSPRM